MALICRVSSQKYAPIYVSNDSRRDRLGTGQTHRWPGTAKRAVAIALRNRWRRTQVAEPLRTEITPKNILMIGPTGVGKTEIARRLARLANAPFIKIEATKFTEVGYVGRDVDTIIRDLVGDGDQGCARSRPCATSAIARQDAAEDRVLDVLLPPARGGTRLGAERDDAGRKQRHARSFARSCARANSTTRKSKSKSPRPRPAWKFSPRRAWRT